MPSPSDVPMTDAEAEAVLVALGGGLQWQWSLRSGHHAHEGNYRYYITPPDSYNPMWMLSMHDTTEGLILFGGRRTRDGIPCSTLGEAQFIGQYFAANGDWPDGTDVRAREYAHEMASKREKAKRRKQQEQNRKDKLRCKRRCKKDRRR